MESNGGTGGLLKTILSDVCPPLGTTCRRGPTHSRATAARNGLSREKETALVSFIKANLTKTLNIHKPSMTIASAGGSGGEVPRYWGYSLGLLFVVRAGNQKRVSCLGT